MKYSLHPDALGDLRDAASFYREQAGTSLSQSFLGEIEQSINKLLLHPGVVTKNSNPGRWTVNAKGSSVSSVFLIVTTSLP